MVTRFPNSPSAVRSATGTGTWSLERPPALLAVALLGAVLASSGYFVIDWGAGLSFADVRHGVTQRGSTVDVITQVYVHTTFAVLLIGAVVATLCAPAKQIGARLAVGGTGLAAGLSMVGVLVWVAMGGVGRVESRHAALPALTVIAALGIVIAALAAGALFDTRGQLARGVAATVAGLALVWHAYAINSVVAEPGPASWVGVAGYALLIHSAVWPHRRVTHVC